MKQTILQQSSQNTMETEVKISEEPEESEIKILCKEEFIEVHETNDETDSERTETLSCPSQKLWISSQESDELPCPNAISSSENDKNSAETEKSSKYYTELQKEVEIDQNNNVVINKDIFEDILGKANKMCDLNQELALLRSKCLQKFGRWGKPITDPGEFRQLCREAGSLNLYDTIIGAMRNERQSEQRQLLNERRAVSIIYMMMYGQSQQANWFQVATARTVKGLGVSSRGIETLRNMGLTAHPSTATNVSKKMSLSHHESVNNFFEEAILNEYMVVIFIDDYHNIHTTHRPSHGTQTQPAHMATLLLKSFQNIQAIYSAGPYDQDPKPANNDLLSSLIDKKLTKLAKSYVEVMPDWLQAKFFDPESERYRLLAHDYQQHEILKMRSMENCKLVDCVELPLKSYDDFNSALQMILDSGLSLYLNQFVVPIVGDWPCQFYVHQIVYHEGIHNLIPFIGPLHISLNARENIVLKFHNLFSHLYAFLFSTKKPLAKKPKPWRISFLLEVLYGGWLLVRDAIMSVFVTSKDVQYLVLLNLLDSYVPLSLSIYSVVFRNNMTDLYYESLLRCWVMFLIYRRRHYDKAPLIALSNFEYWKSINHPLVPTLLSSLCAFDEYPVENFHSVLRAHTRVTDTPGMISLAAKEIDARKHELGEFQSAFVPERKQNFAHKNVEMLKIRAAEFLTQKFKSIFETPNAGKLVRAPTDKSNSRVTTWNLPTIFGAEKTVTNDVLPLGFLSHESSPDPNK